MAKKDVTIEDLKQMDLDALELEVQELEGKLHTHVQAAQAEIDGRKQLIKVIRVMKFGKPPRKKRAAKTAAPAVPPAAAKAPVPAQAPVAGVNGSRSATAERIREILKRGGKMKMTEVAKAASITEDEASFALNNNDCFDMDLRGLWFII